MHRRIATRQLAGEMATGIATSDMVIEMARGGMLGFFGAGGLSPGNIEWAIDRIEAALQHLDLPWGVNLRHRRSHRCFISGNVPWGQSTEAGTQRGSQGG